MKNLSIVIGFVGSVLVLGVAGIVFLAARGLDVPDVLQNVTVAALAGLVGLLVPASAEQRQTKGRL